MEQVMTRMPKKLKEFLTEYAKKMGISLTALIVMRCWELYEKEKGK